MELNHQIRLCRPFPFLFGFRANRNDMVMQATILHFLLLKFLPGGEPTLRKEHTWSTCILYCNRK
jgi:hypothetical protein